MRTITSCAATLFVLALHVAPASVAEPLTVGIELHIEARPVLAHLGPEGLQLLETKLLEGLLSKLASRLTDWDFKASTTPRYNLVVRAFEFVPGEPPDIRVSLQVLDRGKIVIPNRTVIWRKVGDQHGFKPPESLAIEILDSLNTVLEPVGWVTAFRQHVAIGSGAEWTGRATYMTLGLTQDRHRRLVSSRFLIDSRPQSCRLQSNGTGIRTCSQGKAKCLEAKAICCVFRGFQRVEANRVSGLLQYRLGDIFLDDDVDNELSVYEPEACR